MKKRKGKEEVGRGRRGEGGIVSKGKGQGKGKDRGGWGERRHEKGERRGRERE